MHTVQVFTRRTNPVQVRQRDVLVHVLHFRVPKARCFFPLPALRLCTTYEHSNPHPTQGLTCAVNNKWNTYVVSVNCLLNSWGNGCAAKGVPHALPTSSGVDSFKFRLWNVKGLQILRGSLSSAPRPIFTTKCWFFSIFRDLRVLHTSALLKSSKHEGKIVELSAKFAEFEHLRIFCQFRRCFSGRFWRQFYTKSWEFS